MFAHLVSGPWSIRRSFPGDALDHVEQAVERGETQHSAELRVAVEHSFNFRSLLLDPLAPRERAIDVFSLLRVWDTEQNNGVLIYILLADQDVEIIADRGAAARIEQAVWDKACEIMRESFQYGKFEEGTVNAIDYLNKELALVFVPGATNPNELPNRPAIL
jgi:hypothetical protein